MGNKIDKALAFDDDAKITNIASDNDITQLTLLNALEKQVDDTINLRIHLKSLNFPSEALDAIGTVALDKTIRNRIKFPFNRHVQDELLYCLNKNIITIKREKHIIKTLEAPSLNKVWQDIYRRLQITKRSFEKDLLLEPHKFTSHYYLQANSNTTAIEILNKLMKPSKETQKIMMQNQALRVWGENKTSAIMFFSGINEKTH